LDTITSSQLSEWEVFDRLEPLGAWREDYRMAYLAMTMVNIARQVYDKHPRMTTVEDHMPSWNREYKEEQSVEEMKIALSMIARAFKDKPEKREGKAK
jgi:hypothetical protein